MSENNIEVSIIVLTKNAQEDIHNTISTIINQQTEYSFETIVIDSGSQDNTVEILNSFPKIKLIYNKAEEFQHGRTRNLGGKIAKGKYLVFLNGDALPKDSFWLDHLLENFEVDETIAGVYSRHLPKNDCHSYMALEILNGMKPIKELRRAAYLLDDDFKRNILRLINFSTVSCAIKKEIWNFFPFCEDLPLGEDQEWAKRVLGAGYSLVYEPASIVFHSHNRSLREIFKYHFDSTLVFNSILRLERSIIYFPYRSLVHLFGILAAIKYIKDDCRNKNYSYWMIFKEIMLTISSRCAAFLGEIFGNIKSAYKPIKRT